MKTFIGKHKKLLIFLLLAVAAGAGGFFWFTQARRQAQEKAAAASPQKTAQIERRTLVESVSATGKVASLDQKSVDAEVTGVSVVNVNVKVGDQVAQGDVLCVLDAADLEEKLADTKASLSASQGKSQVDVSAATRGLAEAESARSVSLERADEDMAAAWNDYQKALGELSEAEAAWNEAKETTASKNGEYELSKKLTQEAKEALDNTAPDSEAYQKAQADYQALQQEEAQWQTKYNTAQQNETSCKNAYEQAQSTAQSKLDAYNQKVRSKEDAVTNNDSAVSNKEDSLKTSNLNASVTGISDKQQIKQYEEQIAACTVTAPIGGIVTAVAVEPGDSYSGGALVTIEDISGYEITAEIEEYDIGVIKVGQQAVIKTNGTGDLELTGAVKEIAPKATTGGTGVTYTVKVSVDTPCDQLKMDMTAKLSIILQSKENVLTVPYDSLQEDETGKSYIEVLEAQAGRATGAAGASGAEKMPDAAGTSGTGKAPDAAVASGAEKPAGAAGTSGEEKPVDAAGTSDTEEPAEEAGTSGTEEAPDAAEASGAAKFSGTGRPTSASDDSSAVKFPGAGRPTNSSGGSGAASVGTKRIYVTKGIESDYYVEVSGDGIEEGMSVIVPTAAKEDSNARSFMQQRGPMGGF